MLYIYHVKINVIFIIYKDKAASTGISNLETKIFDRVQFQWNGKKGAKIFVRFNCLSTDFSRIKGVKGIPLRIHVETKCDSGAICTSLEKSFAKIKLFRDKVINEN